MSRATRAASANLRDADLDTCGPIRADLEARGPRGANLTDASSRFQLGQRGPPRRRRRPRDLIEVGLIEVGLIEVDLIEVDLIEVGLIEVDLVDVDLTMDGESMRARS